MLGIKPSDDYFPQLPEELIKHFRVKLVPIWSKSTCLLTSSESHSALIAD
jgi:hypothetical protein